MTDQQQQTRRLSRTKEGRRISVTLRLPADVHRELVETADKEKRSIGNLALMRYELGCQKHN